MTEDERKAETIRREAQLVALELVAHAKETARQMLLGTNLDTSKIPLICNKIIRIEERLAWMQWAIFGICGGIGYIVLQLIINSLKK